MAEFKAHFKSVQPDLGGSLPGNLIFGIPGEAGGYYTIQITQPDTSTMRLTFLPSKQDMDQIDPVDIILPEGPKGDPGQADEDQVKQFIVEYLTQNPPKVEETDPTVPEWAKQPQKPAYTAAEVGAVSQEDLEHSIDEALEEAKKNGEFDGAAGKTAYEYAKEGGYTGTETEFSEKLAKEYPKKVSQLENDSQYINAAGAPVQSINGKTGKVQLAAADVGARPSNWMPTAQEVGALPDTYVPPDQTAAQVGADPAGTAAAAVSAHNTSTDSHGDLRLALKTINDRLTAFFDSDNQTLDELSEIVAYITSNKSMIDSITTSKVSVEDIINNLTTNVANKPLSAAQGVVLKGLIDGLSTGKLDANKLQEAINTALAQAKASGEFDGKDGQDGSNGKDGTSVTVTSVSESTADGGSNVVTFSDGKTLTVKNGSKGNKGDPGTTPQKGIDFWTPADQEAIVQQVITALGTPVFGTVDANKVITITTDRLVDGTYTLRAENEDGSYTVIGTYTKENEPTYTNLFVAETCTLNQRGNSSGATSPCDGEFITDYIDLGNVMANGGTNVLHYKGMYFDVNGLTNTQGTPYSYLNYYDANKVHLGHVAMRLVGDTQTEAGDYVTTLDAAKTTARYIRVSAAVSPKPASTLSTLTSKDQLANIKITLNETITD